jgi:hypothetical protein
MGGHLLDQLHEREHRRRGLEVDVEPAVGELLEQLGHRGDGVQVPDPGRRHLVGGELGEQTGTVGDPVERRIVEGEEHAVAGRVHVGLEVAVTQRDGVPEGVQGVLGAGDLRVQGATAVRHRQHRPGWVVDGVEIGVPGHGASAPHRARVRGHSSSIHPPASMVLPNRRRDHLLTGRGRSRSGRRAR